MRHFIVRNFNPINAAGQTPSVYLMQRYTNGEYGYFAGEQIIFFKDEGHRDDFASLFGGEVGYADPQPRPGEKH